MDPVIYENLVYSEYCISDLWRKYGGFSKCYWNSCKTVKLNPYPFPYAKINTQISLR